MDTPTRSSVPPSSHYSIGEAADLLGVSVATIRLYEREGLILPFRRDSKHRRFSAADLERLQCLRRMINVEKVSIAGIRRLLALIPCWTIRGCPPEAQASCTAFRQTDAPCWMAARREWKCRNEECRNCDVYTTIADCHTLKHTIAQHTTGAPGPSPGMAEAMGTTTTTKEHP